MRSLDCVCDAVGSLCPVRAEQRPQVQAQAEGLRDAVEDERVAAGILVRRPHDLLQLTQALQQTQVVSKQLRR